MASKESNHAPQEAAAEDHEINILSQSSDNEIFAQKILDVLRRLRGIDDQQLKEKGNIQGQNEAGVLDACWNFVNLLETLSSSLRQIHKDGEAEALVRVVEQCLEEKSLGGLGLSSTEPLTDVIREMILLQTEAWLLALNSAENSRSWSKPLTSKPPNRRPMTLAQKIFAHHAIGDIRPEGLKVGDVIRVGVDWIVSSEISWVGLSKIFSQWDSFTPWRNDRLWLAGDHVVDPRTYNTPLNRKLIGASDKAAKDYKLTDYKGPNYTIIHTEFVRERAEPGMMVIGADSHTCSAGAVGCLAVGLGAADVVMPLVTGETWFKIPESLNVRFIGEPGLGIGGKDIILYILKELKRNTVASDRVVEFTGPGVKHLSCDARFAISNMCTEFGAITGVFVPDENVSAFIGSRKRKNRKSSSVYFQPDEDAEYAQVCEIDLAKVDSFLALYPSPDNVVPVTEKLGVRLDGCFIGACTTTEEDLILGALVLKVGLARNLPLAAGTRQVTPGSLPIVRKLEALGLLEVYKKAGFRQGAPGCSYCVGMGADQAGSGETWLSSQNRNFQNRMGKGSFANIASAATVAASSFNMEITDPRTFLAEVDMKLYDEYRARSDNTSRTVSRVEDQPPIEYVEPNMNRQSEDQISPATHSTKEAPKALSQDPIKSKVVTLGEFIDTDALAPADILMTANTDAELADHCMENTVPEFRAKVRSGCRVLVAGKAFGCGSSREQAARALLGLNVACTIAPSYAFIYSRNGPNLGLLSLIITDPYFYTLAQDGVPITVELNLRKVYVGKLDSRETEEFSFEMTDMERRLVEGGGMSEAYRNYGKGVFEMLCAPSGAEKGGGAEINDKALTGADGKEKKLDW
ncbi:hypothetical protein MMC12_005972 [Toensbergia leucococca]|nr:hypothetical protein [Toensbergia leucococca]